MSGNYTGQYQLFGQPNQPIVEPPSFRRRYPGDYELFPANVQSPQPEYVPEYNLWGASPYNPSELINPGRNPAGMFGNLHPSPPCPPPYPPPVQFRPERLDVPPPIPLPSPITVNTKILPTIKQSSEVSTQREEEEVSKNAITHSEDFPPVEEYEEPELTGLEVPEKTVIDRKDLFLEDCDAISDTEE